MLLYTVLNISATDSVFLGSRLHTSLEQTAVGFPYIYCLNAGS
jgi:hypothetical protein